MTDIQILKAVINNGGSIEYVSLLNQSATEPNRDPIADEERIIRLIENHFLEGTVSANSLISITSEGRLHLQQFNYDVNTLNQEERKTARAEARQRRHDWSVVVGGAIVGSIITLVAEAIVRYFFD